jgi:hypothetical protein
VVFAHDQLLYRVVQADAQAAVDDLAVQARLEALVQGGQSFLAGDRRARAEEAAVLGLAALLELELDFCRVQGEGGGLACCCGLSWLREREGGCFMRSLEGRRSRVALVRARAFAADERSRAPIAWLLSLRPRARAEIWRYCDRVMPADVEGTG